MASTRVQKKIPLIPENNKRKAGFQSKPQYYDYSLLAVIILLTCFGLIMLYSTSAYMAEIDYNDDMHYFKKQAMISAACIVGALILSRFDYHLLIFFQKPLYYVSLVTMLLVKSPLGVDSHGAKRWLKIGPLQFQPAEIAKIAVIVCLSYEIVKMGKQVKTLKSCMKLAARGGFLAVIAYVFTDNLSTALIIFGITAGMIFLAHPESKIFYLIFGGSVSVVLIAVYIMSKVITSSDNFRIQRVLVWLHPEDFASGKGYQTMQSLYAIGSGGILGRGLGNSIQKLGSVPEAQNDMIFSIICEELGLWGSILVVVLFAYLLYRLLFIAQNAPDLFGGLMVCGIFIHIALQVVLNISVVLNVIPNTGVTLPFISYGGTSVLFLMSEMGLALSVSRQIKLKTSDRLL